MSTDQPELGRREDGRDASQEPELRRAAILESMLDPHVLLRAVRGQDGTIVDFIYADANKAAWDYMGIDVGHLLGARLLELHPGQAGAGMLGLYAEAVDTGEPLVLDDYAYLHETLHDERRHDIRGIRVGDALSFTWRDVTDRHRQAEALAASEKQYRLLAENASDVVAQSNPDGTIVWVSESVTALLGWRPEDMVGRKVFEFLHPDDLPVIAQSQARIAHGEPLTFEARVRRADGDYRWVASHIRPILDDAGTVTSRVAGWRDVHAQHLATEALADSEDQFRTAMDNSAVGMCLVGPDGRFLRVNAALCQILGRSAEVLMASTWQQITHPDDLNDDLDLVNQVLRGDRDSYRLRKRYLRPGGEIVWGDLSVSCVRNNDGTVRNFISQISDVTEMRQATVAAKEAESKFRLMASNASDVVFTAGTDRLITWVSPNITDTLGWEASDWVGHAAAEFVHPEDLEEAATTLRAVYSTNGGAESFDFRARWRTRTGTYVWMLGKATRVIADDGGLAYVVAGLRDITDEVAAQDYLASVLDAAIDPHIMFTPILDTQGRVIDLEYSDLNPAACAYLRTPFEAIVGKRVFEVYGGGASQHLLGWCAQALAAGEPVVLDNQTMVSEISQDTAWFDIRAVPVNGQVAFTFRDITARRNAAHQVAASEEKFRLLAENAADVVVQSRDGAMVWISPSLTGMLGWAPQDWIGHRFEDFTHPDDLDAVSRRRTDVNSGRTVVTRLRLRDTHEDYHWSEIHASPFEGQDGTADGIVASFRTIDAQIEAENVLKLRARYDELTGMLNRAEVFDRLRALLYQQPRTGHEVAVAFCDLDDFKAINDTYGHLMGDHVLKTVAVETRELLRDDDLIARIGGDEILLVLTGVHDLDSAKEVAQKVRRQAAKTHHYLDNAYTPKVSIGVTLLRRGEEPDDVIARADRAMYQAKESGGNQVVAR